MTPEELFFKQNFLYPLILLLVGSLMTGLLIPWYANRQKNKQNGIEELKNKKELEKERSLQDYQFKIKLKQELIDSFHNYWITTYSVIGNFQANIFEHFARTPYEKDKNDKTKATVIIPDKNGKYPDEVFQQEWIKISKELVQNSSKHSSIFMLKLSWYSNNQELVKKFEEIRNDIMSYRNTESNIINCKEQLRFRKYLDEIITEQEKIHQKLMKFRNELVQLKIEEVSV